MQSRVEPKWYDREASALACAVSLALFVAMVLAWAALICAR